MAKSSSFAMPRPRHSVSVPTRRVALSLVHRWAGRPSWSVIANGVDCGFRVLYVVGKTSATTFGSLPASLMMDPPLHFLGAIVDVSSPLHRWAASEQ